MVVTARTVHPEGEAEERVSRQDTESRKPTRNGLGREEIIMARCDAAIEIMAALFDLPSRELRRTGRSTIDIARVRQIAMYVAHVGLQLTMGEVGRGFGRDRTTVLHACHLVEDMRDDPEFDRIVATAERVTKAAFEPKSAG